MFEILVSVPFKTAKDFPERISHRFRKGKSGKEWVEKTYTDLAHDIKVLALAFDEKLEKGDHAAFFVNNRYEWIVSDFAMLSMNLVSVPRGSDTPASELQFIYQHSDSRVMILENTKQMKEFLDVWEKAGEYPEHIFIVDRGSLDEFDKKLAERVTFYDELFARGEELLKEKPGRYDEMVAGLDGDSMCSIIYTSGTTGNPKGVMLTYNNFMQNVHSNTERIGYNREVGDVTVLILPSWHVFERVFEYCSLAAGATSVYTSLRYFASDLKEFKPHVLASVPRIWESVYQKLVKMIGAASPLKRTIFHTMVKVNYDYGNSVRYLQGAYLSFRRKGFFKPIFKTIFHLWRISFLFIPHLLAEKIFTPIRDNIGGRMRGAISGGGALPHYIDSFFNSVGIRLLNAYGMTECAPGILSRSAAQNTIGATGTPFMNTEVKIFREDGKEARFGEKGILHVKGPQVMLGYYKNEEATKAIFNEEGWLNTGDLAVQSVNGDIVLVGRSKDTIVLAGGENVEPEVIEDKLKESPLIDYAVVMGQDKKGLTAVIAVNEEELKALAEKSHTSIESLFGRAEGEKDLMAVEDSIEEGRENPLRKYLEEEVDRLISKEQGFKPFERIVNIIPVKNDFQVGKELTQSLKIKRKYINERFQKMVDWMEDKGVPIPGRKKKKGLKRK